MRNYEERIENILKRLDEQITFVVAKMKMNEKFDPEDVFFDNGEFMKLMNISKRTAQEWRNKKIIEFSQVGNKIYYRLSDIQKLLNDNYNTK
ncbi:helix-turn-helix domain-containing protein [Flavobacterium sp.]|uniref:helix-turn-helix domain-containing protein n=1 Tax=Flavobacterium sp. TaxID=239 RepID=UPI004047DD1E